MDNIEKNFRTVSLSSSGIYQGASFWLPFFGAVEKFFVRLDLFIAALDFDFEGKYVKKRVGSESKRSFEVEVILLPSSFYIIHTSHTAHRKD